MRRVDGNPHYRHYRQGELFPAAAALRHAARRGPGAPQAPSEASLEAGHRRCSARSSSIRLAHTRGPPSWISRRCLRAAPSSFLASGTQRVPHAPICTTIGSSAMAFLVSEWIAFCLCVGSSDFVSRPGSTSRASRSARMFDEMRSSDCSSSRKCRDAHARAEESDRRARHPALLALPADVARTPDRSCVLVRASAASVDAPETRPGRRRSRRGITGPAPRSRRQPHHPVIGRRLNVPLVGKSKKEAADHLG